jgi:hypothetical protein
MKHRIVLIVAALLAQGVSMAQDVIIDKKGNEINGKVIEITGAEVKFTGAENPDGFVFTTLLSDLFMIKYADGTKKVFTTTPVVDTIVIDKSQPAATMERIRYSGPRIGVTVIGDGTTLDYLEDRGKTGVISQFGWQLETRIFTLSDGTSGLVEYVGLVGGMEQGLFLPSLSVLFGMRSGKKGLEAAAGPNLSLSGLGVAFAVGGSFKTKEIYFPINLAIVPSVGKLKYEYDTNGVESSHRVQTGIRLSLIIGFNTRE